MEDYIFIIIAIILSVIGAISQGKKKRAAELEMQKAETDEPERPSVFDALFEDDFFNDSVLPVKPVETPAPPPPVFFQPPAQPKIKTKPAVKPEMKKPGVKSAPMKRHPVRNKIAAEFSLKKAVIYSEILNRKY
ncbi:hypothetical protein [Gaoshiqia sp. Z1-71]|uniref:hypothetical protein n=1 Tax=Gaoshiqia hydrogeniformans TaxID=3290090 RepID=UPI003BF82ECA